jgi:hypothetical protein
LADFHAAGGWPKSRPATKAGALHLDFEMWVCRVPALTRCYEISNAFPGIRVRRDLPVRLVVDVHQPAASDIGPADISYPPVQAAIGETQCRKSLQINDVQLFTAKTKRNSRVKPLLPTSPIKPAR